MKLEELIDQYINEPSWYNLTIITYYYDVTWDKIKNYVESKGGYMLRCQPNSKLIYSKLFHIIKDYENGDSMSDLSYKYELPKSSISSFLKCIDVSRERLNPIGRSKAIESKAIITERLKLEKLEYYNKLPKFKFRCCYCDKENEYTLSEIRKIFSYNYVPTCRNTSCSSVNTRLYLGFPDNAFDKTRLIYYYKSQEFKELLYKDLENLDLSLIDISNKYGFTWKYLRYTLIPYHFDDYLSWIDDRKSNMISNRINKGIIYNSFKDSEWQKEYGGSSYRSGTYFSTKLNKEIRYRSSWELEAYELLDKSDNVLTYEIEPFAIDYEFNGYIHKYLPDILITFINGYKKLVEIKPYNQIEYNVNVHKFRAAEDYCKLLDIDFIIIHEFNWDELCEYVQ